MARKKGKSKTNQGEGGLFPLSYDVIIALVNYPVMSGLLPMELKNVRFAVAVEKTPSISTSVEVDPFNLTDFYKKLSSLMERYTSEGKKVALACGVLPRVVHLALKSKFGDSFDVIIGSGKILLEMLEDVFRGNMVRQVDEFPFGEVF